MIHLGSKTIETERLILRRFAMSDVDAMFNNWANDEQVTKYLVWQAHRSKSETKDIVRHWIKRYRRENFYQWAIVFKEINEPIGSIGISLMNENIGMAHIGYCIGKSWWQQGITSEALAAVICFLFEEMELKRIESRHDTANINSGKVMQKCGMIYEGTLRQNDYNNQGICDSAYYAILAEDYFQSRA